MGAVVVGFDKNINYYKIQYACLCIRENPGCLFIATNLDAVTHLTDAQEWAGNGAMVGAIKGMASAADGHLNVWVCRFSLELYCQVVPYRTVLPILSDVHVTCMCMVMSQCFTEVQSSAYAELS